MVATPVMQTQAVNGQVIPSSGGSFFVPTRDPSGAPIDVSSGYTVVNFSAKPQADQNSGFSPVDLSSFMTPTFSSTGVNIAWTTSQSNSIANGLPCLHSSYSLAISSDSGTTQAFISNGVLTVNRLGGNL